MTLSATILEAQEFARRLTLKADGVVLAYDEVLGGFSWASATPATPVTTGTAAQRAAVSGSAGQLFHETDTSVLLQWTAVAAAWKAVAAPGAWTSASRPPVGTTDAAYEGLEVYEQDTGKVMVLRRTTLGVGISGGNPLIWVFAKTYVTAGAGMVVPGTGTIADPYVPAAKNRLQLANPVRNASMQITQRGTSFPSVAFNLTWTLDGWQAHRYGVGGSSVSWQESNDTQGSRLCLRYLRDAGNANTTPMIIAQSIVTPVARQYAGKQVTFSFRARCGANYSAASSLLTCGLSTGTGVDQNTLAGFTGSAGPVSVYATLTTSWQTFTGTATLASNLYEIGVTFIHAPTGTAGAADYFEIKDVRIDEGPYALEHVVPSFTDDLLDARRYCRVYGGVTSEPISMGTAWVGVYGGNASVHPIDFALPMRAAPTNTQTGNWEVYSMSDGVADVTNLGGIVAGPNSCYLIEYRTAGNWATGAANALLRPKDTTARLILSAEI